MNLKNDEMSEFLSNVSERYGRKEEVQGGSNDE